MKESVIRSNLTIVFALLLTLAARTVQSSPIQTSFSSAAPCSGLFTVSGFVGCSSEKDRNLNIGPIKYFDTLTLLNNAVSNGFQGSYILPTQLWCNLTVEQLKALEPVASSLTIVEESDQPAVCPPSRKDVIWNKLGTGIGSSSFHYPIMRLSRNDSLTVLAQSEAQPSRKMRFDFYMGKTDGSITSTECLSQRKCSPVGGNSVWGTVKSPPLSTSDRVILLAANMDSTALFHDLAFGFHAAGGDIAIVLAVTKALAEATVTPLRVLTGIFQGEAFHRIGSRRFVKDIIFGKCQEFTSSANKSCVDPPNFSLEWTKFQGDLTRIKGVVALNNILRSDRLNGTFIHAFQSPASNTSTEFADRFAIEVAKLGREIEPAIFYSNASLLPPSALSSFAEIQPWALTNDTGGILLTGFKSDISEANPHFETEADTMDVNHLDSYIDDATLISTALARTLFFFASEGTESSISTDRDLVSSLIRCLGGVFATDCPMAKDALNLTSIQLETKIIDSALSAKLPFVQAAALPLTSHTGVYFPLSVVQGRVKLREEFLRNVLANLSVAGTVPPTHTGGPYFSCSSDVFCRDEWPEVLTCPGPLVSNSSVACVGGRCICSTVTYHEAWSPDLVFDAENGTFLIAGDADASDPIWTEPFWTPPFIATFTTSSTADVAIALTLGLALTMLTALTLHQVIKSSSSFGKFKLA